MEVVRLVSLWKDLDRAIDTDKSLKQLIKTRKILTKMENLVL